MLLSESLGKNPNLLKYNITIEQNLMQPYENPEIISYSNLLSESFLQLTGQPLLASGSPRQEIIRSAICIDIAWYTSRSYFFLCQSNGTETLANDLG
jgi:hypothetical protein